MHILVVGTCLQMLAMMTSSLMLYCCEHMPTVQWQRPLPSYITILL